MLTNNELIEAIHDYNEILQDKLPPGIILTCTPDSEADVAVRLEMVPAQRRDARRRTLAGGAWRRAPALLHEAPDSDAEIRDEVDPDARRRDLPERRDQGPIEARRRYRRASVIDGGYAAGHRCARAGPGGRVPGLGRKRRLGPCCKGNAAAIVRPPCPIP